MDFTILGAGGATFKGNPSPEIELPLRNDIGVVWLLIPAYNVAPMFGQLIDGALKYLPADRILVVDDGSTDQTGEIAHERGVMVISHESNQGKGAALRSGFDHLCRQNADWIITMDGDLQHAPALIPAFIEAAAGGEYDVVIGCRQWDTGGMPWDRRFSNRSTSLILSLVTGLRIRDSQCGFRLIRRKLLDGLKLRGRRFEFETECLLRLARRGARLGWVGIPTMYDGAPSSINRFTDTIRFVKVVLRHLISGRER